MKHTLFVAFALLGGGLTVSYAQVPGPAYESAALQKPQLAQSDFSIPEKTILSFVSALNAYDVSRAVACVLGGKESPSHAVMMRSNKRVRISMALGEIKIRLNGDDAEAEFSMDLLMEAHNIPPEHTEEKIALKNENGKWLLVAPTKETQKIFKAQGYVAQMALAFVRPKILSEMSEDFDDDCSSGLKVLAKAALRLAKDNQGVFSLLQATGWLRDGKNNLSLKDMKAIVKGYKIPVHPQLKALWQKALWPYRQNAVYFMCMQEWEGDEVHEKRPDSDEMPVHPVTKLVVPDSAFQSYDFNQHLIEVAVKDIKDPARTVLLYEGQNGQLNFRHMGKATVAFVDGYAKMVGPDEAKKLIWNPKGN